MMVCRFRRGGPGGRVQEINSLDHILLNHDKEIHVAGLGHTFSL